MIAQAKLERVDVDYEQGRHCLKVKLSLLVDSEDSQAFQTVMMAAQRLNMIKLSADDEGVAKLPPTQRSVSFEEPLSGPEAGTW